MTPERFLQQIRAITDAIGDQPLDAQLQTFLMERFPPGAEGFEAIAQSCLEAVAAGWMCEREHGGIRYGRVLQPEPATRGFSVDVVDMNEVVGPRHAHPNGEIDMIMPLEGDARFDGQGRGWLVYGPGSVHRPTVSGGRALVLYLLPEGAIDFIR
ncbi:MAG: DUF4863 family protein [Rhodocyclaceae bacterium]|nr:DUF4863 family protein [Rhodocyclaceae bacterium]